ncbi:MAG: hypothetical protein ABSG90_06955 [Dehalococcoidia bacterium]|jgi:hypothetical protein
MIADVIDMVEPFLSEDQRKWGKLSSNINYRRLHLLLLREILLELRKQNQ